MNPSFFVNSQIMEKYFFPYKKVIDKKYYSTFYSYELKKALLIALLHIFFIWRNFSINLFY